jgi:hypothetical protein
LESCPKVENSFGYNYGVVATEGEERSTMETTSHAEIDEHKTKGYGTARHVSHLIKLLRLPMKLKILRARKLNLLISVRQGILANHKVA